MSKDIFEFFKNKLKIIIGVTVIISLAISAVTVVATKKEEVYEKQNTYLINYKQSQILDDKNKQQINETIKEHLDKTNNSLSIKIDTTIDYSAYEDIVKNIIHSDKAYDMLIKNTGLQLTKKQYDAMLWEEFTGNGMILILDVRHHNKTYCDAVGKEISHIIKSLLAENFDTDIEALEVNAPVQEISVLTAEEEQHLVNGIGHSYKEKELKDILTTGIKNFAIIGIVTFIGILLLCSIRFYAQLLKDERK